LLALVQRMGADAEPVPTAAPALAATGETEVAYVFPRLGFVLNETPGRFGTLVCADRLHSAL
jgi:hypothetical protein